MSTLAFRDVSFVDGRGATLLDSEGRQFIDFFADVGTASLGYKAPEHLWAARTGALVHLPNLYGNPLRDEAAARLCAATAMDHVFFCNSGTEAVEAAIKLARKRVSQNGNLHRYEVWSVVNGFHGRTMGALAAGDGPPYHYAGFGQLPPDFHHFIDIEEIPKDAAAVILAPVFGNNDVFEYSPEWLGRLRKFTSMNGIALIFDEVQTGSGRCGHYTYAQSIGIEPDIVTLAKGLGAGAPVGACLATGYYAEAFTPGSHFSTFGGSPLCSAYVLAMLGWLDSNMAEIWQKGARIKDRLRQAGAAGIRGTGMLIGFDYPHDTLDFASRCFERGLLVGAFRSGAGPVKITPPLNISDAELENGLDVLVGAM